MPFSATTRTVNAIRTPAPPSPQGPESQHAAAAQPGAVDKQHEEVGENKTPFQHAGNAGFAAASVLGAVASSRAGRMLPGLNLGVAAFEGYNAVATQRKGEHIAAMGHAGNATGCLSSFLEDGARYASAFGLHGMPAGLGYAVLGFGVAGGLFGIVQGFHEIQIGRALRKQTGSSRTLKMGIADFISGAFTLAGIALNVSGISHPVGNALLLGATVCDLSSIGVDYLDTHKN